MKNFLLLSYWNSPCAARAHCPCRSYHCALLEERGCIFSRAFPEAAARCRIRVLFRRLDQAHFPPFLLIGTVLRALTRFMSSAGLSAACQDLSCTGKP